MTTRRLLDRAIRRHTTPREAASGTARPRMALIDYRKLCPRSGHVLTRDEREALGVAGGPVRAAPTIRCEACGRDVALVVHPGTGRSLIYPMHVKTTALSCPDASPARPPRAP